MRNIGSSLLSKAIARPELARITRNARAPNVTTTPARVPTAASTAAAYRSLCQQCHHHHRRPALIPTPPSSGAAARIISVPSSNSRLLHTTAIRLKKGKSREPGGKDSKGKTGDEHKKRATHNADASSGDGDGDGSSGGGGGPKHPTPTPEEPLDFADVKSRIAQHDEHFAMSLKKLRSGGRFNPDVLGALRVEAPDAAKGTTYPLRELAQVVPRGGRTVSILAHEAAAVKPIMSAVQASGDFNQQPQRDPDNELELVLRIEPERREDVQRRVKAVCHEWRERVRQVRQRRDKLHASWQKEKALLPDLKKTADKELDKIIKAKMAEIDGAEKEALKVAESGTK
ncbi:hypothetical protein MGN70_006478 [Eutypa lata]|nr:hypothetical protein MGN70_006478 [Eutypa lata]